MIKNTIACSNDSANDEAGQFECRGSCSATPLWLFLRLCFQDVTVDVLGWVKFVRGSPLVAQPVNSWCVCHCLGEDVWLYCRACHGPLPCDPLPVMELRLRFLDVAVNVLGHKLGEGCSWFSAGVATGEVEVRNVDSAAFISPVKFWGLDVADVGVCSVRKCSCLLGAEVQWFWNLTACPRAWCCSNILHGLRRAWPTRPRTCYQHPAFFTWYLQHGSNSSFARVRSPCSPKLCWLPHLRSRHPEPYENHPRYRFLQRFEDRKGCHAFHRKTGYFCCPPGGVMVRWSSSSREGGWQFEGLTSGVSSCITPCACAPVCQGFR